MASAGGCGHPGLHPHEIAGQIIDPHSSEILIPVDLSEDRTPQGHFSGSMAGGERFNPILRGWVNYFAIGHSSRCFGYIRDWVEKKIRRHLARAAQRQGFGWKRWSREWLYGTLGLFLRVPGFASAVISGSRPTMIRSHNSCRELCRSA
jgi:hypothetical protein